MPTINNRIFKSFISIILITALILSGLFSYPQISYAEKTVLSDKTYYHFDLGVQLAYNEGSEWGSNTYGTDEISGSWTLSFGQNIEVENVYPLEGSGYDINSGSENIPNDLGDASDAYQAYYADYVTTAYTVKNFSGSGNKVTFSYKVDLNSIVPLDVVVAGEDGKDNKIYQLFGGQTNLENDQPIIADAIEIALAAGLNGTANGNNLYLVFVPTVIEYKKCITVGDLEAQLSMPDTAKQGEDFTLSDDSILDDSLTLDYTTAEWVLNDGTKELIASWEGTGNPGENSGGIITQSFDEKGRHECILTAVTTNGQVDTDTKYIDIFDSREITVVADLALPAFTYEGHTELAQDQSTFEVDGVAYSATRAYAEDIAKNSFKANTSFGSVSRLTDTKANVTFSKRGTYTVTLTVDPISGSSVTDTESIEVRKTPYIIDNLSGFQKQNRKQILNVAVATYPGKPLTDYSITLKDKVTGNSVILTPDNLQENTTTIKTRSVTMTQDIAKGFAYITVEFLTKTPAYDSTDPDFTQDFYYEINVEDSKGDPDTASKTFAVSPDIPPTAAISLDSAFLRNEGTNTASITAEDVTVAVDGDSVERTWYYAPGTTSSAFTNISAMDGYKKLSFGTDKIVGFNKVGVGKFTTRLYVKEVWTEPTIEEYVTDSDHLTGTAIAYSDVQNVAPVVSLELLNSTEQEILLLANSDAEYQTLLNNKTALQQALLANQIDGQIIIKKLVGNTPSTVTGVALKYTAQFPYDYNNPSEGNILAVDSERTYLLTYTWTGSGLSSVASVPKTIHAISPYSGEVWRYTTSRNEDFTFGQDDTGKYLYLIYADSGQTVMLDKRTGAVAGTINIALSDKVWISDNLAFVVQAPDIDTTKKNLYAIDLKTMTKVLAAEDVSAVSRVGGNLQFVKRTNSAVVRCILDMETLAVEKHIVIETGRTASPSNYTAICIDSTGKIVLWKDTGTGTDTFRGMMTFTADNKAATKAAIGDAGYSTYDLVYALDEQGKCNYVMEREKETSGTDTYFAPGFNLNTGAVAYYSNHSTNYALCSYQGAFESKGTAYFMFSGEDTYYDKGTGFWWNPAYIFQVSGSSCSFGFYGPGFNLMDENMKASDRMAASIDGDNEPGEGILSLRILTFPKTLAQETAEIISRFTDKLTYVGGVNTTADEIKTSAEAPKQTMKITAGQDGYLSRYNLSLDEDKSYYYDYEIKPLTDGTISKLTGITAATGTTTSKQPFLNDTYYVENTYFEDFQDTATNEYFTLAAPPNGSNTYGSSLTFTVPSGKKAILSLDYTVVTNAPDYIAGVYIDGERAYVSYPPDESDIWHHYTHYKVLSEGTHTMSCQSGYWYAWIDNLKVEILSPTRPTLKTTFSKQKGDNEGWVAVEGSFETPNGNISYGSQASTYSVGMIPYVITRYFKNGNPRRATYTQTVPSGYIQRGWAYPTATTYESKSAAHFVIAGSSYDMLYRAEISPGQAVFLDTRTEGTYTHTSDADYNAYFSFIPSWALITYPNNAVTATNNISFDNTFTKYFFPKETSTKNTNLSIYLPKGEYLIKNLKLYYIENGQKIYLQNEDCEELTDISKWTLSTGLSASIVTPTEEKTDDEYVKIYKKGEKVLYNIFYSDYEKDPSKTGYWVYTHVNWPPDAVHPDVGKILTAPIDRFYLSGKYTVTHWEVDSTQRTETVGNSGRYDKESNKVTMTFYVDGAGKAPWITYIKTNPATVKENDSYTLKVGVDDTEKDTLTLETEVYFNGKSILADTKRAITANADGEYSEQAVSGLPIAKAGVYQVICTVSDYSGTGIKSYKFTVVSEGKITGFVNHTDQWDNNRKKYNLKRFSEEVNRPMQLDDYLAMDLPRKRGTNVFWSGEKLMLRSETEGNPSSVKVQIWSLDANGNRKSTGYSTELSKTGKKTASGAELWEGSLWDKGMINKWGRKMPEQLLFSFTAYYSGGTTKNHEVAIIVDSKQDYWQLHRLW